MRTEFVFVVGIQQRGSTPYRVMYRLARLSIVLCLTEEEERNKREEAEHAE